MTVHYVDGYVLPIRASVAGLLPDLEGHGNRHGRHFWVASPVLLPPVRKTSTPNTSKSPAKIMISPATAPSSSRKTRANCRGLRFAFSASCSTVSGSSRCSREGNRMGNHVASRTCRWGCSTLRRRSLNRLRLRTRIATKSFPEAKHTA